MKRKAGWLLILCIALASASLLLPTGHAERSDSIPASREQSVHPVPGVSQFPVVLKHSDLVGGKWLAAAAPMPWTPLNIALDIQATGLSSVVDGVGLQNWDRVAPQSLNVNIGGPVQAALLYWGGQDFPCTESGGVCVIPFQPYEDQIVSFGGSNVIGTIIGTESSTNASSEKVNNIGYLADVTSIVQAAGTGMKSFSFGDGDAANNLDSFKGASLVVIFTNAGDSQVYRLMLWDGMDYAFSGDPTAGDPRTTAPVSFNHGSHTTPRPAELTLIAGDGEAAKADETTVSNNPTLLNLLDSSDDGDGWDTDTPLINIPAGVGSTTVQINSPASTPDEFFWQVAILRVPLDVEAPTCTHTETDGPPKVVTFTVEDNDSGIAEILVTKSENADTVVPPFTVGTNNPVVITSTKIDQSQVMKIEIRITDVAGNVKICSYDDTCTITCPANITQAADPGACSAVVTYNPPTTTGECGEVTCTPPSGSSFPVGTTTVFCRALDESSCGRFFAVDTADNLLQFSASSPGIVSSQAMSGLTLDESIVGIDFRPATGALYGLARDGVTTLSQIVVINTSTGAVTRVGSPFSVSGTDFGFDFNPMVDRIRIVSDADVNLSVNPNNGAVTAQTPLNPGNPNVVASAYSNNVPNTMATTLYGIDSGTDRLVIQTTPAAGSLINVGGTLGVDTSGLVGFDISQCSGTAFAVMEVGGVSNLYAIDLAFGGSAILVGEVGEGNEILGMSIEVATVCSFTVTVNDTQPPSLTCPVNQIVNGEPDTTSAVVFFPPLSPGYSDNCTTGTIVCSHTPGASFPQGTTTVTCTATDNSGNTATCSFTITVNIPPGANDDHYFTTMNQALTIPAPGVLSNDTGFPSPTAVAASGSTSAGGTFTLTFNGQVGYTPPPGFTGTDGFDYTATNSAGSDTAHVTLTVTDPATISLRISEFRENGPGASGPFPAIKSPGDSNNIIVEGGTPSADEFIEIYNHTPTDVQVGTTLPTNNGGLGVFAAAGNGVTDNVVTLVCRIPDGTIIRARGYLLCTNMGGFSGGYSLNLLGLRGSRTGGPNSPLISGPGFTSVGDFPIINGTAEHPGAFTSVDIPNDAGLLLANVGTNTVGASSNVPDNGDFGFGATGVSPFSFTVYDRIGFAPYGSGAPLQTCQLANTAGCGSSGSARPSLADNYCEGGPTGCLRPVGDASTTNHGSAVFYGDSGQYSLLRRQTTLNADGTAPQDTNNNSNDILMVAPRPGINIAFNITNFPTGGTNGLVSVLGAAGPQNSDAPPDVPDPGVLQSRLFASGRTLNQLPNAERRYVIDDGGSPENAGNMNTTIQANNPLGSFIFRFGFRNVSSETLQQLRFRVDQLAVPCGQASPSPALASTGSGNARNLSTTSPNCQGSDNQTAVLKVLNMPTEVVARESIPAGTPETVRGSVIEDTGNFPGGIEMAQNGGGINNSLVRTGTEQGSFTGEYATVVPAGGPYFFIGFRLGVVKGGSFKFIIQPEGLPSPIPVSDGVLEVRSKTKE